MKASKQFDTIFDECLQKLLTGEETVEQCLQRYPEHAGELEPLLRSAMMVNEAVDVKPSDEFRARARYQMQSIMAASKAPKRRVVFAPRWAMAVGAMMLIFVLGGGTAILADNSMPGSILYPVKLATESVRLALTTSDEQKAELYTTIADRRMKEMTAMAMEGNTDYIEVSATRLSSYYAKLGELTLTANMDADMLGTEESMATQEGVFDSSVPAPDKSFEVADSSPTAATVPELMVTASAPEAARTPDDYGGSDDSELTLEHYAIVHPEELQALIDSDEVPESVKPALRRALYIIEQGLSQALSQPD